MILVTGATGHIGNVLVRELLKKGWSVRALVLPEENAVSLDGLAVEIFRGDVLDPVTLNESMKGVELVFHLAGMISILSGHNEKVWQVNVEGTKNVIKAARQNGVRRMVHTSSIHALKRVPADILMDERLPFDPHNPVGIYDRSKAEASLVVLAAIKDGLEAVIVCPTGVIGPYDFMGSEMGKLISGWLNKEVSFMVDGAYDFVDVRDVAQGMILAAENGECGEVYILSGEQVRLPRLHAIVGEIAGLPAKVLKIPARLALFIANFAPMYYRLTKSKPRFTRYSLETVLGNSTISSMHAQTKLGYRARSLYDSITDTVRWWKDHK